MKIFSLVWSTLAKIHSFAQKLQLYNYPSIFTLLERDTNRWFEGFAQAQILYTRNGRYSSSYEIKTWKETS